MLDKRIEDIAVLYFNPVLIRHMKAGLSTSAHSGPPLLNCPRDDLMSLASPRSAVVTLLTVLMPVRTSVAAARRSACAPSTSALIAAIRAWTDDPRPEAPVTFRLRGSVRTGTCGWAG